jgi:hypothetical protein
VAVQEDGPKRHIPEAWFGNLTSARVLFISSNPSIDPAEDVTGENFPRVHWEDEAIADWVTRRVDQSWSEVPVTFRREGFKDFNWRCLDGEYRGSGSSNSPQPTWNKTHHRAVEILGKMADPSSNYALTEVVHCKSQREIGVSSAAKICAPLWLNQIIDAAKEVRVIIICGSKAVNNWAREAFALPPEYGRRRKKTESTLTISRRDIFVTDKFGRRAVVAYMGQPAYSATLSNIYGHHVVGLLGDIAAGVRAVPESTEAFHALVGE